MLKKVALAGVALMAFAGTANAADITFNFANTAPTSTSGGSNNGNSLTYISDGLTLTAKAFGQTGGMSDTTFETAKIFRYAGNGLGVCNREESCTQPNHQVDNVGDENDIVQFLFSQAVTIKSVTIERFSSSDSYNDLDVSYWLSTDGSQNLNGATLAGLGSEIESSIPSPCGPGDCDPAGDERTVTINSANTIMSLLFGGLFGGDEDDAFKIRSITVSTTETNVSEPGTLAAFGLGLAALGYLGRRRKA